MLNRKRLTFIVLLFLSILSVRFLPGCGEGLDILTGVSSDGGSGVNWADWSYRREITVSNSGSAQSDYQVNVIIDNDTDFYTKAAANGDDIRFSFNGTSIPYWIELWDSGATHKFSVWVKVPSVSNPGSVIYIYYGNSGQAAASDFDSTFTKDSGFSGHAAGWHMDEGSGSAVDDFSSNTNDGTITNALWAGADGGKWYTGTAGFSTGDSLNFDGAGDYVKVTDSSSLDVTALTIALWFKADSAASTQYLAAKWLPTGNNRAYSLFLNSTSVVFETSFDGSAYNTLTSTSTISASTWYHLAATFSGTTKIIYINGTADNSAGSIGSLKNSSANLTLGTVNDVTLADYYDGIIDEVSIYDRALSANEVKALSQRSKYSSTVSAPVVGSEELVQ